ncbi:MAG TPA: PIN domain-containing protein [Ktedonobacterales bacterium]
MVNEVLLDSTTADLYGDMRHDLAARGLLIPDNDTWIAATAVQYGLTLARRDAHFTRIAGLHAELW